jgi:hypothetical protein
MLNLDKRLIPIMMGEQIILQTALLPQIPEWGAPFGNCPETTNHDFSRFTSEPQHHYRISGRLGLSHVGLKAIRYFNHASRFSQVYKKTDIMPGIVSALN